MIATSNVALLRSSFNPVVLMPCLFSLQLSPLPFIQPGLWLASLLLYLSQSFCAQLLHNLDGGCTFHWNISKYLSDYMVLHFRRQQIYSVSYFIALSYTTETIIIVQDHSSDKSISVLSVVVMNQVDLTVTNLFY